MSKILNFGFIAVVISALTRWYIVTDEMGIAFLSNINEIGFNLINIRYMADWEKLLYGISILWFMFSFWNVFVRTRCSKCGSSDCRYHGSKEVDRWVGTKSVRERVGDNSYANRSVSTTFVKLVHAYQCRSCNHSWETYSQQEKIN